MAFRDTVKDFWNFLMTNKRWWLIPMVAVLLLVGALIILSETTAVAPFVYTLF